MKAADHIYEAENLVRKAADAADMDTARTWLKAAEVHALIARAVQEEERLDGCSRHHGQVRP